MRGYGAGPVHLIALLAGAALAVFAATDLFATNTIDVGVWFVGAAVVHDTVLIGAYGTVTVGLVVAARQFPGPVPWLAHVLYPAAASGLLLLVYLPTITERAAGPLRAAAGYGYVNYAGRWLAVTGVLIAASAAVYAVRFASARRTGVRRGA